MKKINLLAIFAMLTLATTSVMAQKQFNIEEFNTDTIKEMQPQLQEIIEQELDASERVEDELPDYQSLNQQMINMIQKAINENKGTAYNRLLEDYQEFLTALNTIKINVGIDRENIYKLIKNIDISLNYIPEDERLKYIDFLCKQDRYFLKKNDSIVNMAFLQRKGTCKSCIDYYDYTFDLIRSLKKQEPVKIKAHTFWKAITGISLEEVGDGFLKEAETGK